MIKYRRKKRLGKPDQPSMSRGRSRSSGERGPIEKSMHVAPGAREPSLAHLSLSFLSRPHCDAKEKGNAHVSENRVKHRKQEMPRRNELLRSCRRWKVHGSRNFPQQMSYFHRLYGYNNSTSCRPADRLVKVSVRIVISPRQSRRRRGCCNERKKKRKEKKTRNETTVPKQTTANEVKRPSPSGRWTAKWLHLHVESVRVVVSTECVVDVELSPQLRKIAPAVITVVFQVLKATYRRAR